LLAMNLWPGALAHADAPAGDFEFIAANDLHYQDEHCGPFFADVRRKIGEAAPKAELVLALGDMANRNEAKQLAGMRDILRGWKLEARVIRGNHDWVLSDDEMQISGKEFEQIYPDSLNYTFDYHGWQFIALDSTDGPKWQYVEIQPAALQWLDDHLPKLDRRRPTILMTHVPMGQKVREVYRMKNADALLDRLKPFNLRAVLCGHYHGQSESRRGEVVLTTGKCCSFAAFNHDRTPEKGFFVCSAKAGRVEARFVEVPVRA
jgi:3',5'-cyclic AMP phosphodiesterase CpdA